MEQPLPVVSKWLWMTFIIVFLIGALFATWYYMFGPGKTAESTTTTTTTLVVADKTADWKTYTNVQNKFSVKYPLTWAYREYPGTASGAGFRLSSTASDPANEFINVGYYGKSTEDKNISFDEYVKIAAIHEAQNYEKLVSIDKITTESGVVGYKTTWQISGVKEVSGPITYFPLSDGSLGGTIRISANGQQKLTSEDILAEYNKMIKTLQFTTASAATADWKTFTNDTYGFSFKYPKDWTSKNEAGSNAIKSIVTILSSDTSQKFSEKKVVYNEDMSVYYYDTVAAADGQTTKTAKTLIDLLNDKSTYSSYTETTIAGQKAYDAVEIGYASYFNVIFEKNGHIFKIFFANADSKNKLTDVQKSILSTFQFTK